MLLINTSHMSQQFLKSFFDSGSHCDICFRSFRKIECVIVIMELKGMVHLAKQTKFLQCRGTDEITAIIAHEMGHWKLNHTVYAFVAMQVCSWNSSLLVLVVASLILLRCFN